MAPIRQQTREQMSAVLTQFYERGDPFRRKDFSDLHFQMFQKQVGHYAFVAFITELRNRRILRETGGVYEFEEKQYWLPETPQEATHIRRRPSRSADSAWMREHHPAKALEQVAKRANDLEIRMVLLEKRIHALESDTGRAPESFMPPVPPWLPQKDGAPLDVPTMPHNLGMTFPDASAVTIPLPPNVSDLPLYSEIQKNGVRQIVVTPFQHEIEHRLITSRAVGTPAFVMTGPETFLPGAQFNLGTPEETDDDPAQTARDTLNALEESTAELQDEFNEFSAKPEEDD